MVDKLEATRDVCDFYLGDCQRCGKRADRFNQDEPCPRGPWLSVTRTPANGEQVERAEACRQHVHFDDSLAFADQISERHRLRANAAEAAIEAALAIFPDADETAQAYSFRVREALWQAGANAAVPDTDWQAEMPTIWEDPAGKGYPCFERPMTPAEARDTIERYGRQLAEFHNDAEDARSRVKALEAALEAIVRYDATVPHLRYESAEAFLGGCVRHVQAIAAPPSAIRRRIVMGENIAEVAAGLTEAQREFIASRPGHWWTLLPSSERRAYRGLVRRWGYETNCLTPRGRALQAHLISQGADYDR